MTTDDTPIIVNPGDLEPELRTTLGAFLADNQIHPAEATDIRAHLDAGVTYAGGGGAAGLFTVRPADTVARTAGAALEAAYPFGYHSDDKEA